MIKRVYNISLLVTSAFVYLTWKLTEQIDLSGISNNTLQYAIMMLMDFVLAFGFFHVFAKVIIYLSNRINIVKRLILGASYVEGVWVGYYYLGDERRLVFCIEQIEQSLDDVVIVGEAYYEDKSYRGSWSSNDLVSIDVSNYSLVYLYSTDFVNPSFSNLGVANFRLQRRGHSTCPERLIGYTMNVGSKSKDITVEKKLSKLPHKYDTLQLLEKAIEFYHQEIKREGNDESA